MMTVSTLVSTHPYALGAYSRSAHHAVRNHPACPGMTSWTLRIVARPLNVWKNLGLSAVRTQPHIVIYGIYPLFCVCAGVR